MDYLRSNSGSADIKSSLQPLLYDTAFQAPKLTSHSLSMSEPLVFREPASFYFMYNPDNMLSFVFQALGRIEMTYIMKRNKQA